METLEPPRTCTVRTMDVFLAVFQKVVHKCLAVVCRCLNAIQYDSITLWCSKWKWFV